MVFSYLLEVERATRIHAQNPDAEVSLAVSVSLSVSISVSLSPLTPLPLLPHLPPLSFCLSPLLPLSSSASLLGPLSLPLPPSRSHALIHAARCGVGDAGSTG